MNKTKNDTHIFDYDFQTVSQKSGGMYWGLYVSYDI